MLIPLYLASEDMLHILKYIKDIILVNNGVITKMNNGLNNHQIAFILFGIIVGYGIVSLPKEVAESVGTGGWITILLSTVLSVLFTYILTYLGYIHENKTLFEYGQELVGKFLTYVFSICYIVFYFSFFTLVTRVVSEVINLSILLNTPVTAISLLFIIVMYYAVIKGLTTIARFSQLYGIIIIVFSIFIYIIMFTQGKLVNIRPFWGGENILVYLKGIKSTLVAFLGMSIITVIPINRKVNKKVFKYTTVMIFFIGLMYILVVESCISVIGVEDIIHYEDALIASMRRIEIPYLQFLGRLDGIVLSIWMIGVITTIVLSGYGCTYYTSKIFSNVNFKLIAFVIAFLGLLMSRVPKTSDDVRKLIEYTGYAFLVLQIIPLILLVMTKVKGYGSKVNTHDKKNQ